MGLERISPWGSSWNWEPVHGAEMRERERERERERKPRDPFSLHDTTRPQD
jgi:hypothetical protein